MQDQLLLEMAAAPGGLQPEEVVSLFCLACLPDPCSPTRPGDTLAAGLQKHAKRVLVSKTEPLKPVGPAHGCACPPCHPQQAKADKRLRDFQDKYKDIVVRRRNQVGGAGAAHPPLPPWLLCTAAQHGAVFTGVTSRPTQGD